MLTVSSFPGFSVRINELAGAISLALLGLAALATITLLITSPAAVMSGGHFMYGGYMFGGLMPGGS